MISRLLRHGGASRPRRGEDGYVLATVLGVVLLLTLIGIALLAFVLTSLKASKASVERADADRSVDSALETAVQKWRADESLVGKAAIPATANTPAVPAVPAVSCATKQVVRDGLTVTCANEGALNAEQRILNVTVSSGSPAKTVGRARVRIIDEVNGIRAVGYSLEVCDWLVGNNATETLKGCASNVTP